MSRWGSSRAVALALVGAVVLLYATRTVTGWIGGRAEARGGRLSSAGLFVQALPDIERGAVGAERAATLWLSGETRLGLYQARLVEGAPDAELDELLRGVYAADSEAITLSPASGWHWAALADVYHQRERRARYRRGVPLDLVGQDRWALVGRDGRIAVGMVRLAIAREPTQYVFRDQLAFLLLQYGLREQALEAVRESARVQPHFAMHAYTNLVPLPDDVVQAFADGARRALGEAPLLPRVTHLLALGQVELRLGRAETAERDLREALGTPGTERNHAEAWYWLGRSLQAQGRDEEASQAYRSAEVDPVFEAAALASRAAIAERGGDTEEALALLRRARRERPDDIGYALAYARIAREHGRLDWAEEALRWAHTKHSGDARPYRLLIEVLREKGDTAGAEQLAREMERRTSATEGTVRPPAR